MKAPGYYGSMKPDNEEGVQVFIIFEDLSACATPQTHPGLTARQLLEVWNTFVQDIRLFLQVALTLADLQAWSLAYPKCWKEEKSFQIKSDDIVSEGKD